MGVEPEGRRCIASVCWNNNLMLVRRAHVNSEQNLTRAWASKLISSTAPGFSIWKLLESLLIASDNGFSITAA